LSFLKVTLTAFGETLLACHAPLYRYARSLSRDPGMAEELVQETCRRALAAQQKPAPLTEENTRAWLFTILRNLWHNELRRRQRWNSSPVLPDDVAFTEEPVDAQVTRKLLQSEVRHAIDMLPEPYREVVLLRDIEGLSYADIARLIGCPSGTVMSRLSRARDILRRVLLGPASKRREVRR
jgi:RNA polymerase sigma-70 factor (ECF subfamily)